jgi:RNA polymerase sigma factor (sigma-70 family)
MVYGVCRRLLGDAHDAEDAFQATFLILARKAASIQRGQALAAWLHEVARHVAARARDAAARRRDRERQVREMTPTNPINGADHDELRAVLDEELAELPPKYGMALVLCDLEGRTHRQAARELGCAPGSVSWRLSRARALLRGRLTKRGLTLSATALTLVLTERAAATMPAMLAIATVRAATAKTAAISTQVASLVEKGMQELGTSKLRTGLALLLATTLAVACTSVLYGHRPQAIDDPPENKAGPAVESGKPRVDQHGDPLPPGAVARLGTVRFRPGGNVYSVAYAPGGKVLASGCSDGSVRLWDPKTGKEIRRFIGRPEQPNSYNFVESIAFSPDGKTLAAGYGNGESMVRLWDMATGKELRKFDGHQGFGVHAIALSADGKLLASGSEDGTIGIWDAATGALLRRSAKRPAILAVAFHPDGKTLVSSDKGDSVRVWEVSTGKELRQLRGHKYQVFALVFSPDGKTLAAGGEDTTIRLWDTAAWKEIRHFGDSDSVVWSLAFAPDGRTLASTGFGIRRPECAVRIWDVATGKEAHVARGHQGAVRAIAFSSDGKTFASGGFDLTIRVWDATTAKELLPASGHQGGAVSQLVYSPNGKLLASGCQQGDRGICLWDVARRRLVRRLPIDHNDLHALIFSPDGTLLAGATAGMIRVWEANTGKTLHEWKQTNGWASCLAFSPDGQTLACGGKEDKNRDGQVILWDMVTGKELGRLHGHSTCVHGVVILPDGKTLASRSCEDGTILFWELATRKELRRLSGQRGGGSFFQCVDQDTLVYESARTLHFLDLATGEQRRELRFQPEVVWHVTISPDRKMFHGTQTGGECCLWEIATGKERLKFLGPGAGVSSLSLSPDGKTLASGSADTSILLWDLAELMARDRLRGPNVRPADMAALWIDLGSADGTRAYGAVWTLVAASREAVPFLAQRVKPMARAEDGQLARWIADLDSAVFAERDKASRELERQAELAESLLRKALESDPSPEVRRRVEALLGKLRGSVTSAETLRSLRVVEVLEHIATPEARQLLRKLADGAPQARSTREAKTALERLVKQATVP